jgi:mannose-1-phosphate guanylyltransferase
MSEFEKYDGPSKQEDQYFARENAEALRKLAHKQNASMKQEEKEALKALHFMKCPRCGMDLHVMEQDTVQLETCFNCHGIWLDAGGLEKLLAQHPHEEHSLMKAVLNLFKSRDAY